MGGYASALVGVAKDAAKDAVEHIPDLYKKFGPSMDTVMRSHPAGAVVADYMQDFVKTKAQTYEKLDAPARKLWEGINKDSSLATAIDPRKTTIQDIHQHLQGKAHPLQNESQTLLMQNLDPKTGASKNADLKMHELDAQSDAQANLMARTTVLGSHMENILPSIEELMRSKDPNDNMLGQFVADSVSNITKDTTKIHNTEISQVKDEINKGFDKKNKINEKYNTGVEPLPKLNANPTYSKTTDVEREARGFLVNRMADMAFIPHLSMLKNIDGAPMRAIVKGIMDMRTPEMQQATVSSGILNQTLHSMFDKQIKGSMGIVSKVTGSQQAGELLYKATHMPLFDMMRFHQISLGASVGYHSALMWGKQAVEGNKRAIAELTEMRLDPEAIAKRGGKLTDDELQTAMFHYTNNRFFVDRPMDRTIMANRNVFMRSATMFHATINSQYYFMKNELKKMAKSGDYKGIAQFAATSMILFPAIAPWIKSATILARTASPQQAGNELKQNYDNMQGKNGFGNFAESYIEMLAYIGGAGVFMSYMQAAMHDRLATALLGPMIGTPATIVQDTTKGILQHNKAGKHNFAPLARDITSLSVPVVGKWLGYKLFPAKTETSKSSARGRRRVK